METKSVIENLELSRIKVGQLLTKCSQTFNFTTCAFSSTFTMLTNPKPKATSTESVIGQKKTPKTNSVFIQFTIHSSNKIN